MSQDVSPYSNYEFLQTQGDMVFTGRAWLVLSHAAVLEGLSHPELSARRVDLLFPDNAASNDFLELRETLRAWTFFGDLVDVKAERKFIWDQLGPVALSGLSEDIERWTDMTFKSATVSRSRLDVLEDLTRPLRRNVLRRFLEIQDASDEDIHKICDQADLVFGFITGAAARVSPSVADLAMKRLKAFLSPSEILKKTEIAPEKILSQLTLLLVVSIFIEKAVSNVMAVLVPRWNVVARATDLNALVREALRMESPTQVTSRIARRDFEWRGQKIENGQQVSLVIGAANRDPAVFTKPEEFQPERYLHSEGPKTLTFGSGGKRCPGEWMTATIVESVFRSLIKNISLSPRIEEIDWFVNPESRRPMKFIVRF